MKKIVFVVLSVSVFSLPLEAATRQAADVLIRHVTVVDVEHAHTIPNQAVATVGEKIVAVGNDTAVAKVWSGRRQVEGKGRYLIPGLWDMHVHFGGGPALMEENKALLPTICRLWHHHDPRLCGRYPL